jgi:hypothetical protein
MKKIREILFILILVSLILISVGQILSPLSRTSTDLMEKYEKSVYNSLTYPNLALNGEEFSNYNLSIRFDELSASVEGNLTVDFYNNDPINITKIPFHLYLSGMAYISRPGYIEILNVTEFDDPNISLPYGVYSESQLMEVNLSATLEPSERVKFIISFNSTIPDGGIDRSNFYGEDGDQSKIFKFAGFYPIPCVYDQYDEWNTDPYLSVGDPFYFDMAYYNFFIEAPNDIKLAATGELIDKVNKGLTSIYHFDPIFPVREVTFSASKWFLIDSNIINGVNVSTYYLPKSQSNWKNYALTYSNQALLLFNETFGSYPYPTLNIVEEYTMFGGMEYPCQVYITEGVDTYNTSSIRQYVLEFIIAHEVSHQWWYNLVGNDEVDWGFLDEGLACWSEQYYGEIYHGDWEYFQYDNYLDEVRNYYASEGISSKINISVYEAVNEDNYYFIAYTKAPLILEKLRKTIGNSVFIDGLKLFFQQMSYKIALLSDLQSAMETVYGHSLDWFFFPWFDNLYLPKYHFLSCIYDVRQEILNLKIIDLNKPYNPYNYLQNIPIEVYDKDNTLIFSNTFWINSTTNISIPITDTPKVARLVYTDDVLVQLDTPYPLYLEETVKKVNKPTEPFIPGYDLIAFIPLSLGFIVLLIIIKQKKF